MYVNVMPILDFGRIENPKDGPLTGAGNGGGLRTFAIKDGPLTGAGNGGGLRMIATKDGPLTGAGDVGEL